MKGQEVDWSEAFDALEERITIVDTEYNMLYANKAFVRGELKMVEAKREIKEHRDEYRRRGR